MKMLYTSEYGQAAAISESLRCRILPVTADLQFPPHLLQVSLTRFVLNRKDADLDIPIFIAAEAEYAKLL
jgi:hypothetical protein